MLNLFHPACMYISLKKEDYDPAVSESILKPTVKGPLNHATLSCRRYHAAYHSLGLLRTQSASPCRMSISASLV